MKTSVYNQKAEVVGDIELNDAIYGIKPNIHLLAEAVRIQASNARKGLAHTKTRGEVSGGGKKPWRQKGTGRARAGSIRSPIWRHGGITFGPRSNRNWELKINKKAKTKALFMSLSDKAKDGKLVVIEGIKLDAPKTKQFLQVMNALEGKLNSLGKKQMLVMPKNDEALIQASRNIPHLQQSLATSLNVTDVLKADSMIVLKESLAVIEKTYLKESMKPKAKSKASAPKEETAEVKPVAKPARKAPAKKKTTK